jgi:transposase
VRDQRFGSAYLFGAVCPERDTGCALILPEASAAAMALFLTELAAAVPAGAHAVVLLDRAGWHGAAALGAAVPPNLTLVPLPAYAPELNAIERVWEYLRERYLSHRLFKNTAAIIDACCAAWNRLLAEPGRIRSLGSFPWLPASVSTS